MEESAQQAVNIMAPYDEWNRLDDDEEEELQDGSVSFCIYRVSDHFVIFL